MQPETNIGPQPNMTEPNMGSPLPEQPIPSNVPPSLPENKSNKKLVIILVVVILILAGGLAYVLFGPKKSPAPTNTVNSTAQNSAASPQLLYTSSSDITLIDSAVKQVYKTKVPTTGDYIFYEAQSPSSTSSRPITFVAIPAFAVPRIFPTINRWRGIPLRSLL